MVIDAIGLYDNIPPTEGVQCVGEALQEKPTTRVPWQFITRLMQLILDYSLFEFIQKKLILKIGRALSCSSIFFFVFIGM